MTAPEPWEVVSNSPTPEPDEARRRHGDLGGSNATPRISSYITALIAGPYESTFSRADERVAAASSRSACTAARACGSTWTPTTSSTRPDRASPTTRRSSATPYPFAKYDQLFVPEFNAGAMENAGAVTFTETYVFREQGDGRHQGASRRHDPARARPHVVRRPRDHEVVERPLAERVVRRVGVHDRDRRGHRVDRGLDDVQRDGEDLGVPAGPAALDAPGRRRRSTTSKTCRSTSTASRTPRAARCSSSSPPGSASSSSSPASRSTSASTSGRQHRAGRPAHRARDDERARAGLRGRRSGSRPPASTRSRPRSTTDVDGTITRFAIVQTAPADYPTIRPHRLGVGFYDLQDDALVRVAPRRAGRRRRPHRGPRARSACARPDLVLLNDDDLAYAKIRLDAAIAARPRSRTSPKIDDRSRARWSGVRRGTDAGRRGLGHATTSISCCATSAQRPSRPRCARRSGSCSSPRTRYVAPEQARRRRASASADGALAARTAAEAGSDSQLQFVKAFASAASTPAQREQVRRDCATARRPSTGLDIDTDLSWQLLVSLAAGGLVTAPRSTRRSPPTTPRRAASSPRRPRRRFPTSRPQGRVGFADREGRPAEHDRARRRRSASPTRRGVSLLGEFVQPYFDMLLPIWESRSYQIAQYLIVGLYPAALAEHGAARRDTRMAHVAQGRPCGASAARQRERRGCRACAAGAGARRPSRRLNGITPLRRHMPRPPPGWEQSSASSSASGWNILSVAGIIIGAFILSWILKLVIRRVVNRIVSGAKNKANVDDTPGARAFAARCGAGGAAHANARLDPAEHRQRDDRDHRPRA